MSKQNSRIGKTHVKDTLLKHFPDSVILVEAAERRGATLSTLIKPQTPSLQKIDLGKWKNAGISARNVDSPNRNPLYDVYENIDIDSAITAITGQRTDRVKQAPYVILDENGNADDEAKKLFQKEWLGYLLELYMKAKFWGPTLAEMFEFDDNGELKTIDEVNRYHVKPEAGIVTVNPTDEKGYDFLNGQQSLYYLLLGKAKDLGLYYKAAPHILAKKYALSTWAEFNEKLGIPFRTVTSPIHDKVRQKQLAVIMENMGSAGWAVLSENEKVELMQMSATNPTQCFENLITVLDAQIALLILRQSSTASSDKNKGTYGSLQILQEVTELTHQADLTDILYFMNNTVIPRLIQFGGPYTKLNKRSFSWDKSVKLSVADTVAYVVELSSIYDIDPDYVTKQTGIPILGVKNAPLNAPPISASKKKSLGNIQAFYKSCCSMPEIAAAAGDDDFEKLTLSIAEKMWNSKQAGVLDIPILKATAAHLREALVAGYGASPDDAGLSDIDKQMLSKLQNNIYVFSGFKTHQTLQAISSKLFDDRGQALPWNEFKAEALRLNGSYNINYLKAEYDHALVCAQVTNQWQDIQKNKDTLPLLKFDATLDKRTTNVCRNLDGVTLPVDDPFWDTYNLPLHWGERSVIRQLAGGPVTRKETIQAPDLQPMFEGNVGKTGIAFPKSHPYYETSKAVAKQITDASLALIPDEQTFNQVYKSKSGGSVLVSPTHHEDELKSNLRVAKILADNKHEVKLLSYMEGRKNPDARIDGILADFKQQHENTQSALQGRIKSAAHQKVNICVISLLSTEEKKTVIKALLASLRKSNWNKSVQEVWFVYPNKKVAKITRQAIIKGNFDTLL